MTTRPTVPMSAPPVPIPDAEVRNNSVTEQQVLQVRAFLLDLQTRICAALEAEEAAAGSPHRFAADVWERDEGGGGRAMVLQGGQVFEKAGVMFSHIHVNHLPASAAARHPEIEGAQAQALGVSLVIHPRNPMVPTTHLNVRFFVARHADRPELPAVWWMGGGFDLTPYYGFEEDCQHWHQVAYDVCAPFGPDIYPRYKKWCDDYFHIRHRQEQRGIGGIFYDDLNEWGFDTCFELMQGVGNGFIAAYLPIVQRRRSLPYTEAQREFQLYRRGRYVEFNLVYDRGTLFGLQTGGRIESILVSLPNLVSWHYRPEWDADSAELRLTRYFLQPRDWLNLSGADAAISPDNSNPITQT